MNKKTVVAVAVIAALLFNAVTPSRARAINTGVLVIGSIAAFVAFVVAGTLLTTHRNVPLFLQEPPEDPNAPDSPLRQQVRFGTNCRPSAEAGQPLVCW